MVPLHDMGVDEAGDPYYVMKFIQGRPLSQVIADFHAQKSRSIGSAICSSSDCCKHSLIFVTRLRMHTAEECCIATSSPIT